MKRRVPTKIILIKTLLIVSVICIFISVNLFFGCRQPGLQDSENEAYKAKADTITEDTAGKEEAVTETEESKTSTREEESGEEQAIEQTETENNGQQENVEEQKAGDSQEEDEIGYSNDFTLLDLDKNEVSLSDFKGKIVVLNFWATWCPPCRLEIPDFVKVYNQYGDRDVQFVGVSLDTDIEALRQFVRDYNINYPILIDGTIENVSDRWGISGIPTTFILDENGKVLSRNVGLMTEDQLVKAIEDQL